MSRRRPPTAGLIVGGLLLAGLVLAVLKWLLITAAILAVPFGLWWLVDRTQRGPGAAPGPVLVGPPTAAPAPVLTGWAAPVGSAPSTTAPSTSGSFVERHPSAPRGWSIPAPAVTTPRRPTATLPAEVAVTVTREEDHQDILARRWTGTTTPVVAGLAASTVTRGTHRGALAVEVRLDGERVGELTAAMSARYADLLADPGTRAAGVVTHSERGFQIDLRLPRRATR